MKLELEYPIDPVWLNQGFGENPDYYSRFRDSNGNPEKGHMGLDFRAWHGQPVRAAHDGLAIFLKDEHGGEGVHLTSDTTYDYNGQDAYFMSIYWHLVGDTDSQFPSPIPINGTSVQVIKGDVIGFADNTGAPFESSGTHLHFGLIPLSKFHTLIEPDNGYNGCIDPAPYFETGSSWLMAIEKLQWYLSYLKGR